MVVRWKLYLQEYTFKIQYIKGLDNVVADNFSRLCILEETVRSDVSEEVMLQLIDKDERFYVLSDLNKVPKKAKNIIKKYHSSKVGHHSALCRSCNLPVRTGQTCVSTYEPSLQGVLVAN
jgi:hypothetical protein